MNDEKTQVEQIHIMSAGEGLKDTFPVALRRYDMDGVFIFTDASLRSRGAEAENRYGQVSEAVRSVVGIAAEVKLPCEVIELSDTTSTSIMSKFTEILARHPDAKFSFNVTGGTKPLALGLFLTSIWVEGECYFVMEEEEGEKKRKIQELKVPRMHLDDLRKNPNYRSLIIMLEKGGGQMSEKDLFEGMQHQYVPQRRRNGSKKLNFSRPTLTGWLKMLRKWGLIEQREGDDLREKNIVLTDEGVFTARFLMASMADKDNKRK